MRQHGMEKKKKTDGKILRTVAMGVSFLEKNRQGSGRGEDKDRG